MLLFVFKDNSRVEVGVEKQRDRETKTMRNIAKKKGNEKHVKNFYSQVLALLSSANNLSKQSYVKSIFFLQVFTTCKSSNILLKMSLELCSIYKQKWTRKFIWRARKNPTPSLNFSLLPEIWFITIYCKWNSSSLKV